MEIQEIILEGGAPWGFRIDRSEDEDSAVIVSRVS